MTKAELKAKLKADIETFKANGGKVQTIPPNGPAFTGTLYNYNADTGEATGSAVK